MRSTARLPIMLLICTLLAVQFMQTQLHMHLRLDPGAQESIIHLASADHDDAVEHDVVGGAEVEIKAQDDTRPVTYFDNPQPALLAAFVILLLLPQAPRLVPAPARAVARPYRAWRLLPPALAPPAHS